MLFILRFNTLDNKWEDIIIKVKKEGEYQNWVLSSCLFIYMDFHN